MTTSAHSMNQMDSIWIEEDTSKLYMNYPLVTTLNSDVPLLSNKKNLDLPPLPPSSFFAGLETQQQAPPQNRFIKAFKKLASETKQYQHQHQHQHQQHQKNQSQNQNQHQQPIRKQKMRISTPFGFSHVQHIESSPHSSPNLSKAASTATLAKRDSSSQAFFCTSPQLNANTSKALPNIPRSASQANTLSTRASSHLFTRSESISTMATTISSKTHSKKNSLQPMQENKSTHQHSTSSSSIKHLQELEKSQITKQCAPNYSSTHKNHQDLSSWDTPDSANVVRQSWIYQESSPLAAKYMSQKQPHHSISSSITRQDLKLFQNQVDDVFNKGDLNFTKMIDSIEDFTKFFQDQSLDSDEQEEIDETIASLRAAKYTRLSRLDSSYENDPKYFNFVNDDYHSSTFSSPVSSSKKSMGSIKTTPILRGITKVVEEEYDLPLTGVNSDSLDSNNHDADDADDAHDADDEEDDDYGDFHSIGLVVSSQESTPTQSRLCALLPSAI